MNSLVINDFDKAQKAIRWLSDRDKPGEIIWRRHLKETKDGDIVIIEGDSDEIPGTRPNSNAFHGKFRHEQIKSAATWRVVWSRTERYGSYGHKWGTQVFTFFIEDDCQAIEFKFFLSDL
jgi:hypothetical protein